MFENFSLLEKVDVCVVDSLHYFNLNVWFSKNLCSNSVASWWVYVSSVLQSEPLQRLFLNKLREVGVAWQKQLPNPGSSSSRTHSCSVHAIRNTRRKMEDRHMILKEFNQLLGLKVRLPHISSSLEWRPALCRSVLDI